MTQDKLLLSSREACRLLNVSQRTLWAWKKAGKIPFLQIGAVVRFSRPALEQWVAEQVARQSAQTAECKAEGADEH